MHEAKVDGTMFLVSAKELTKPNKRGNLMKLVGAKKKKNTAFLWLADVLLLNELSTRSQRQPLDSRPAALLVPGIGRSFFLDLGHVELGLPDLLVQTLLHL